MLMMMNVIRKALGKILPLLILMLSAVTSDMNISATGGVFHVQHKFAGQQPSLSSLIDHDAQRHRRILHTVNLHLNDSNDPTGIGLYYTKIKIGTPSKDYYVSIDTGFDYMWIGCTSCDTCPRTSGIGVGLTPYNSTNSSTSHNVACKEDSCPEKVCTPGLPCSFDMIVGQLMVVAGVYVEDVIEYERVTGNHTTTTEKTKVVFGCASQRVRTLSTTAFDGTIGFSQEPYSMISQIASKGAAKRKFFHCIDHASGGGIFAIGDLVSPVLQTTPLVQKRQMYSGMIMSVMVGGSTLDFPEDLLSSKNMIEATIDSAQSLGYLPMFMYDSVKSEIFYGRGNLEIETRGDEFKRYECFRFKGSVDEFPNVTFIFNGSLQLVVTSRKYLYELKKEDTYCLVWRAMGQADTKDKRYMAYLGATLLSDMIVLYDLENQAIGWTHHDCSKPVLVRDEESKEIFAVSGQKSLRAQSRETGRIVLLLLLSAILASIF